MQKKRVTTTPHPLWVGETLGREGERRGQELEVESRTGRQGLPLGNKGIEPLSAPCKGAAKPLS